MPIEINRDSGINKEAPLQRGTSAARSTDSFERTLSAKKLAADTDALKSLMQQIDDQAGRLSGSQTIRDLQLYKKYVQSFLENAVQIGLKTSQSRSWQQGGAQQTLVKTVNQRLISLTDDLLDKNKDSIDLLGRLGEIRGLLINLYV